jgi:hypothetical protein
MPGGGNVSNNDALLKKCAEEINKSWRKTTDSVLETAKLCAETSKKLNDGEMHKLKGQLEFQASTFSKLVKIGSNALLQKDPVKTLLPPSYSIVYEVAKLKEADLQVAIKDGVINPGMSRSDLSAWLGKQHPNTSKADDQRRPKIIATVQIPSDYDIQQLPLLEKALDKLRSQYGCELARPRDPEAEAYNRMFARMNDYIRKEAKRFIAALKARRLQGFGKLSPAEKKKLWPFEDDEIAIAADAGWDDVKAALDVVGNADQFERIRDEALRLYDVPENVVSTHPPEKPEDVVEQLREVNELLRKRNGGKRDPERYADFK